MIDLLIQDSLRGAHLLCVVLGMGPAFYFDIRALARIAKPLSQGDLTELHRIHRIVSVACLGLWLTGAGLIWLRTGFDPQAFSPKLWSKIGIVTLLTLNAVFLSLYAIPKLNHCRGMKVLDLPAPALIILSACVSISVSCWILALTLGSSQFLQNADWPVLQQFMFSIGMLCAGGVITVLFGLRIMIGHSDTGTIDGDPQSRAVGQM